jgi:IS5 family transposase
MFLKRRFGLSYESVVRMVADNVAWRTFCRIPMDGPVPHYTTLLRWTHDYGEDTVQRINEELLRKLESV